MRRTKKNSSKNLFFMVAAGVTVIVAAVYFVLNGGKIDTSPMRSAKKADDVVVAEVNGKPVYSSEAEKQFSNMVQGAKGSSFAQLDEETKFLVIRELAAQRMILEDAYKKGTADKENVRERVDAFKENVIKEEFLAQMAKDQVTDETIKQRYEKEKAALEGKSQYKVKHILVKTESEAKKVINLLKTKSFEQVAKDKSIDDKTALIGGDLGYLIEGNMIPELESSLNSTEIGGISEPVKTQFGWHVVKLESKEAAEPAPYDQVKNFLARTLYQEAIQNYVKSAVEKADIEIIASASKEPEPEIQNESEEPASLEGDAEEGKSPDAEMGGETTENNG